MLQRLFAAIILGAMLPAGPVHGQLPTAASPWSAHLTAGYGRSLRHTTFGGGLALGSGVSHGRGTTRVGLELAFVHFGTLSERFASFDPLPVFTPTVTSTSYRQRMLGLGLALEAGPRRGAVRPAFLLSAGYYGLHSRDSRVERDSATSQVIERYAQDGWDWGYGVSVGGAVTFRKMGSLGSPRLEIRGHGFAVKTSESWTALPTLSLGVGMAW